MGPNAEFTLTTLAPSVKVLQLRDCNGLGPEGEPMIVQLAKGHYKEALGKFQHLTTYSNVSNDTSAPYESAAIRGDNPYEAGIFVKNGVPKTVCDRYRHVTLYSVKAQEASERRHGSIGGLLDRPYSIEEISSPAPSNSEDDTWWQAQLDDGSIHGPCKIRGLEPLWRKRLHPDSLVLSKRLPGWLPVSEVGPVLHHLESARDKQVFTVTFKTDPLGMTIIKTKDQPSLGAEEDTDDTRGKEAAGALNAAIGRDRLHNDDIDDSMAMKGKDESRGHTWGLYSRCADVKPEGQAAQMGVAHGDWILCVEGNPNTNCLTLTSTLILDPLCGRRVMPGQIS